MPDGECEAALREILSDLSPKRLAKAIEIAREVSAARGLAPPSEPLSPPKQVAVSGNVVHWPKLRV